MASFDESNLDAQLSAIPTKRRTGKKGTLIGFVKRAKKLYLNPSMTGEN